MLVEGTIKLDHERINKLAEESLRDDVHEDESQFHSEGSLDNDDLSSERGAAQESLQDTKPPESQPSDPPAATVAAPAPAQEQSFDAMAAWRETVELNKQLLSLLQSQNNGSRQPQPVAQQQPAVAQRTADDIALYGDLDPLVQEVESLKILKTNLVREEQRRVEADARAAFERVKADYPDAEELIPVALRERAIAEAKKCAAIAFERGEQFAYPWEQNFRHEYDQFDAPRLRAAEKQRRDEAAAKAKQQEELNKISGVPSRGARYQGSEETSQKRKERKPGEDGWAGMLGRISQRLNGMRAEV